MAEFLATAQVLITPVTKGFITALRTQVNEAVLAVQKTAKPVSIKVRLIPPTKAEITAITLAVQKAVTPVEIPIVPLVSGGATAAVQTRLLKQLQLAAAATPAVAPAARGATEAAKDTAKTEVSRTDALVTDVRRQLAIATNLAAQAANEDLAAEEKLAIAKRASTRVETQLNAVRLASAAAVTDKLGATEAQTIADLRAEVIATRDSVAETIQRVTAESELGAIQKEVASSTETATVAIEESTKARLGEITAITDSTVLHDRVVSLKAAERSVNKALAESEGVQVAAIEGLNAEQEKSLILQQEIIDGNLRQLTSEKQLIEAQLGSAAAQKKVIETQALRSKELALATRGAGAESLAALGLRGGTLAASSQFLVGAAAATGFFKAVEQAKEFNTQLAAIQAVTGADREEIQRVSEAARKLGSDLKLPLTSAIDAEQAINDLARAGHNLEDSLRGARGVLLLAASGELGIDEAAKVTTQTLNAFNLTAGDTVQVADVLTNATLQTQGTFHDFATAMGNVEATAGKLGLTLPQTAGLLIQLAQGGLNAADSGTVLRTALLRLVSPTGKAQEEIKKLGISIRDAQGNIRPDVFVRVQEAIDKLNAPLRVRQDILGNIFSQRGIRAGLILGQAGQTGFERGQEQAQETGTAFNEASRRANTLAGSATELKKNLVDLGNAIANPLLPALTGLLKGLSAATHFAVEFKNELILFSPAFAPLVAGVKLFERLKDLTSHSIGIDIKTEDVDKIVNDFRELPQLISTFGESDKEGKVVEAFALRLRALSLSQQELISRFRDVGGQIGKVLKDGVIDPLEIIDLLTTKTGRGFLRGFAGAGSGLEKTVQAIKDLEKELGRVPTTKEISIVLKAPNLQQGLIEVEAAAFQQGTLSADQFAKALAGGRPKTESAIHTAILDPLDGATPAITAAGTKGGKAYVDAFGAALKAGQGRIASLTTQLALAQAQGVGNQGQLSIEQQILAQAQKDFETADRAFQKNPTPTTRKRRSDAVTAFNSAAAAVRGTQDQIQQDQKAAADKAAQNAKDRQAKIDAQLIASIQGTEQDFQNRISLAEQAGNIGREITITKAFDRFIKAKIAALKERIQKLKKGGFDVSKLQSEVNTLTQELFTNKNITEPNLEAQRKQAIVDARQAHLQAQLAIAQTTTRTSDDEKAINDLIDFDQKQIERLKQIRHRTREQNAELDGFRVDLAQQVQALKELKKQKDEATNAQAALAFSFLQAQQGFAANLLGNLLPIGALSGTVGGGLPPASSVNPAEPGGGGGGIFKEARNISQSGQIAAAKGDGVSRGQGHTQIDLLRRIYRELRILNGDRTHPEAKSQRAMQNAQIFTHGN